MKKCIELIETRGTPPTHCLKLRNTMLCFLKLYMLLFYQWMTCMCMQVLPLRDCTGLQESTPKCSGWWRLCSVRVSISYILHPEYFNSVTTAGPCLAFCRVASTASADVQLNADTWDNKTITSGLKDYFRWHTVHAQACLFLLNSRLWLICKILIIWNVCADVWQSLYWPTGCIRSSSRLQVRLF